jgi:hypothetical protein
MAAASSPKREQRVQSSALHFLACFAIMGALLLAVTYGSGFMAVRDFAGSPVYQSQQPQMAGTSSATRGNYEDSAVARLRQSMVATNTLTTTGYKGLKRHPVCSFLEAGECELAPS